MRLLSLAISDVQEYVKRGGIYFWGAGKILEAFVPKLAGHADLTCVKGIVDKKLEGSRIVCSRKVPIISMERFLSECTSDDILIITTKYYEEILDTLKETDADDKVRATVYHFLFTDQLDKERNLKKIPSSFRTTGKQMIPKKIHYCWFGKNPIPKQYLEWMQSWKKYCPEYEIIEWNESNYDIEKTRYMKQAYEARKWGFVPDYARLDIIYNHGGIYLDTDVELIKSIDEFLYNEAFCGFETKEYVNFGLGFGAAPHDRVIGQLLQDYEGKSFVNADGSLDLTPSPRIQTEALEKLGLIRNGEYQVVDGIAVLPEVVLCPLSTHTFRVAKDLSNSYMIHHFAASWSPLFAKMMKSQLDFYAKYS